MSGGPEVNEESLTDDECRVAFWAFLGVVGGLAVSGGALLLWLTAKAVLCGR